MKALPLHETPVNVTKASRQWMKSWFWAELSQFAFQNKIHFHSDLFHLCPLVLTSFSFFSFLICHIFPALKWKFLLRLLHSWFVPDHLRSCRLESLRPLDRSPLCADLCSNKALNSNLVSRLHKGSSSVCAWYIVAAAMGFWSILICYKVWSIIDFH